MLPCGNLTLPHGFSLPISKLGTVILLPTITADEVDKGHGRLVHVQASDLPPPMATVPILSAILLLGRLGENLFQCRTDGMAVRGETGEHQT